MVGELLFLDGKRESFPLSGSGMLGNHIELPACRDVRLGFDA